MGGWFNQGFDGSHIADARKEAENANKPRRYWMTRDARGEIIFLDDEPFCVWEHAVYMNGKWHGNEIVCRKGHPDDPLCPMCASGIRRTYMGFLTVLDSAGWTDDEGKKHKNIRRLFAMKQDTLDDFKEKKRLRKSLVGWRVATYRGQGEKTPSVGTSFDFLDRVDPFTDEQFFFKAKMKQGLQPPEPFDYRKLFDPVSPQQMTGIIRSMETPPPRGTKGGGYSGGGGGGGGGGGSRGRYEDKPGQTGQTGGGGKNQDGEGGDGDAVY